MCNKQQIIKEIHLLEQIKWCYIHYLALEKALNNVENTTHIIKNKLTLKTSLRELYQQLSKINNKENNVAIRRSKITALHNGGEINAIMLFNKDRRFNLTE